MWNYLPNGYNRYCVGRVMIALALIRVRSHRRLGVTVSWPHCVIQNGREFVNFDGDLKNWLSGWQVFSIAAKYYEIKLCSVAFKSDSETCNFVIIPSSW